MIFDTDLCEDSEKALTTNDLTVEKIKIQMQLNKLCYFLKQASGPLMVLWGLPYLVP